MIIRGEDSEKTMPGTYHCAFAGAGGDDVVSAHVRDAFPGRGGAEAYLGS